MSARRWTTASASSSCTRRCGLWVTTRLPCTPRRQARRRAACAGGGRAARRGGGCARGAARGGRGPARGQRGRRGAGGRGAPLEPTVVVALDVTLAMDIPGGGNENEISSLGKVVALKIMDGYSISHPKLVEHFRAIAEREGITHQMEILPFGGTDAGGVQRLHGGIPAVTLSTPCP